MRSMAWAYFGLCLLSGCIAAYLANGIAVQLSLGHTLAFVFPALLAAVILLVAMLPLGWVSFLFAFRFVASVERRLDKFVLIGSSGQEIITADSIRILRRLQEPLSTRNDHAPAIFAAGGLHWIGDTSEAR